MRRETYKKAEHRHSRHRQRKDDVRDIIYYAYPKVTVHLAEKVREWLSTTCTEIVHVMDHAGPFGSSTYDQKFDRGYRLIRSGEFSPEAYHDFKKFLDIADSDGISYEFFRDLEEFMNINEYYNDDDWDDDWSDSDDDWD